MALATKSDLTGGCFLLGVLILVLLILVVLLLVVSFRR